MSEVFRGTVGALLVVGALAIASQAAAQGCKQCVNVDGCNQLCDDASSGGTSCNLFLHYWEPDGPLCWLCNTGGAPCPELEALMPDDITPAGTFYASANREAAVVDGIHQCSGLIASFQDLPMPAVTLPRISWIPGDTMGTQPSSRSRVVRLTI